MKTVGLTGGIASGKSTVAALLRLRGVPVIDADQISREVVAPGSPGLAAVVEAFGPAVLAADGSLDRPSLGARVVDDAAARARLEAITHPLIAGAIGLRLDQLAAGGAPLAVVEAALMVETGSFRRYDAVLLVAVHPSVQRARLSDRQGWAPERVERWLAAQLPTDERLRILREAQAQGGPAVILLDNNGGPQELPDRVDQAWLEVEQRLAPLPRL